MYKENCDEDFEKEVEVNEVNNNVIDYEISTSIDDVESIDISENGESITAKETLPPPRKSLTSPVMPQSLIRRFIFVPPIFLIYFSMYFLSTVYQNEITYKTCTVIYRYNAKDCEPLLGVVASTNASLELENIVQPYASRIIMARTLIEGIVPAIVSLFLGAWSDKFGRRPVIIISFGGYCLSYITISIMAAIAGGTDFSPWLYLIGSIPLVFGGGTCALITAFYSYVSDVAVGRDRALRMFQIEMALSTGTAIGSLVAGYVYPVTNVFAIFAISAAFAFSAFVYVYFLMPESLKPEQVGQASKIREFFRLGLVKDLLRTCIEKRPSYDRAFIFMTVISLTVAIFVSQGSTTVTYLFLRKKFQISVQSYSIYSAVSVVIQIVGGVVGITLLRKVLHCSILIITMLSLLCSVMNSTVSGLAAYWWEMYLALGVGFLSGVLEPMMRTILSLVAPPADVGKIFALATALGSISVLGAAPLYTAVYDATLSTYPGVFNFISTGLYIFSSCLIGTIYGIQKWLIKTDPY